MRIIVPIIFSVVIGSIFSISLAQAEEPADATMETITVTANKIEEDIQDIPQSITVIDEVVLDEKGITSIPEVISEIPNMRISSSSYTGNKVSFRGLNPSTFTCNNPVVLYIDGVPSTDQFAYSASFANVERIEVLRGPQGTLYGKDAIGGVINIVTKTPTDEWHGKVGAEYGSFNYMQGIFNASGPLAKDKLFLGLNGQFQQDDGWIENTYPGMDSDANPSAEQRINGYLLYTPTEEFTARLTLSGEHVEDSWINGYTLPGTIDINEFNRDDAEEVSFDTGTETEQDNLSQSLQLSYDFGPITLASITTHKYSKLDYVGDADFGDVSAYAGLTQFSDIDFESYTQEIRLSGNNETGIRWVGGLYFDYDDREQAPYGQQFPLYGYDYEMNSESDTESTTYAVFGQVMIPFKKRFELSLGGRYQYINKDYTQDLYYLPVGTNGAPMFSLAASEDWKVFLPKVALSYSLNNNWNTYASYSEGYMPGGFNFFSTSGTAENNSFEPQRSKNYEIGIKGRLDRLRVAASIFYMDIVDIHVFKFYGSGVYYTDNADSAHSQGVELELAYRLTDNIELTGAFGIIDAEYDTYDVGDGVSFDGEKMQNTPSYTANVGVLYIHPRGFYSRVDLKAAGETYFFNDINSSFDKEDAYITLDARIGYQTGDWDFYVYGKNLTDEEYITNYVPTSTFSLVEFGDPLTVGAGVRYRF